MCGVQSTLDSFQCPAVGKETFEKSNEELKFNVPKINDLDRDRILQALYPEIEKVEHFDGPNGVGSVAYRRVSTVRQAEDGASLEAQEKEHRSTAIRIRTPRVFWITDAGKSVKEFTSDKLNTILRLAAKGEIDRLIIRDIERVGRKALRMLGFYLELCGGYGVLIETTNQEYDLRKLTDLILTTVKTFAAEDENVKRSFSSLSSRVHCFRNRQWHLPIPVGYQKKGEWLEKLLGWTELIVDIFDYFLKIHDYGATNKFINRKYKDFLKEPPNRPLTRQQITCILQNPVYAGRPTFSGQAIERNFGHVVIEDPNLSYIDFESFKRASDIIAEKHKSYRRNKKDLVKLVENCGIEVLEFIPEVAVLCPNCGEIMKCNGGGSNDIYTCPKCGANKQCPKKKEVVKILEWGLKRERALQTILEILHRYKVTSPSLADLNLLLSDFNKNQQGDLPRS